MVDYWDRLQAAMKYAGVSVRDLQDHLNVSYQAMKKLADGKTKSLTAANHERAARFLKVNAYWLATGEESMELDSLPPIVSPMPSAPMPIAEPPAAYISPHQLSSAWPFESVTMAEYATLNERQKGLIEGYTKRLVEEARGDKSNGIRTKAA